MYLEKAGMGCSLESSEEEVDVVNVLELLDERRQILHEPGRIMVVQDVEVDPVLAARQERIPVSRARCTIERQGGKD